MKLSGKAAVVTGAGRGIGKAIAMLLARQGAKVVINDIDSELMGRVVDEIKKQGGTAIAFRANVVNRDDVLNMMETTVATFKGIHILVNNAGVVRHALLSEMSEEDWDVVVDTDLKGIFNCMQAASRHMMRQRYGKIINISSVTGMGSYNNTLASYAAAKAGVIELTKVAARELGPYGINVNSIAPGAVPTDMTHTSRSKEEVKKYIEDRKTMSVLGRVDRPEDIANAVLFLASDDASFITGQLICVDGGRTDRM